MIVFLSFFPFTQQLSYYETVAVIKIFIMGPQVMEVEEQVGEHFISVLREGNSQIIQVV